MAHVIIITGLRVPLIGRAPRDGKALAGSLSKEYPEHQISWRNWADAIDLSALQSADRLILIGHSFGGARCLELARQLERSGKPVDHLLLLDPVPTDFASRWFKSRVRVPKSVKAASCIARKWRLYPRSKKAKGRNVTNEVRSIGHDHFLADRTVLQAIETLLRVAS